MGETCWDKVCPKKTTRRLAEIPLEPMKFQTSGIELRLAAIPLPESTLTNADPIAELVPEAPEVSGPTVPLVGAVSAAFCLVGCLIKRYARQLKKRAGQVLKFRPTTETVDRTSRA